MQYYFYKGDILIDSGVVETSHDVDWTVKKDIIGLDCDSQYQYYFTVGGYRSPTGTTRTIGSHRENLAVGFANCASISGQRHPNSYQILGELSRNIDLIVSLGDYIYDSDAVSSDNIEDDLFDKSDKTSPYFFRSRYRQIRSRPQVQYAHQFTPWMAVWDDHEITNDCWKNGVYNDTGLPSDYLFVKKAALRAFYEWMPMRKPISGCNEDGWRILDFGDLATFVMLETRLSARSKQVGPIDDPNWRDKILDSSRELIGEKQFNDIKNSLARSSYKAWTIIANQTIISQREKLYNKYNVPEYCDYWDGYPAERERFLKFFSDRSVIPFIFTGDLHTAWSTNLLYNGRVTALEFGVPPISSELSSTRFETMQWVQKFNGFLIVILNKEAASIQFFEVDATANGANALLRQSYNLKKNDLIPPGGSC